VLVLVVMVVVVLLLLLLLLLLLVAVVPIGAAYWLCANSCTVRRNGRRQSGVAQIRTANRPTAASPRRRRQQLMLHGAAPQVQAPRVLEKAAARQAARRRHGVATSAGLGRPRVRHHLLSPPRKAPVDNGLILVLGGAMQSRSPLPRKAVAKTRVRATMRRMAQRRLTRTKAWAATAVRSAGGVETVARAGVVTAPMRTPMAMGPLGQGISASVAAIELPSARGGGRVKRHRALTPR